MDGDFGSRLVSPIGRIPSYQKETTFLYFFKTAFEIELVWLGIATSYVFYLCYCFKCGGLELIEENSSLQTGDFAGWRGCCREEAFLQYDAVGWSFLQRSQSDKRNPSQKPREAVGMQHYRPRKPSCLRVYPKSKPQRPPLWWFSHPMIQFIVSVCCFHILVTSLFDLIQVETKLSC